MIDTYGELVAFGLSWLWRCVGPQARECPRDGRTAYLRAFFGLQPSLGR